MEVVLCGVRERFPPQLLVGRVRERRARRWKHDKMSARLSQIRLFAHGYAMLHARNARKGGGVCILLAQHAAVIAHLAHAALAPTLV